MKPVKVTMNAVGYSAWIPIDYTEAWFGVGVAVVLSEDGSLTYTVQHTFDDPSPLDYTNPNIPLVTIARAGAVATVTDLGPYGIGHGLTTGDSVIIQSSGSPAVLDSQPPQPPFPANGIIGWNVASTPTNTSYTYACANSGPTTDNGNAKAVRLRVFPSTLAAQTSRGTVTYNYPVRAIRLNVTAYAAGYVDMLVLQGVGAR
jgi:hypothetical protein